MVIYNHKICGNNHKLLVHSCPTLPTKTIDIHGNVLVDILRMYNLVNINIVHTTESSDYYYHWYYLYPLTTLMICNNIVHQTVNCSQLQILLYSQQPKIETFLDS